LDRPRAPRIQYVCRVEDIDRIEFTDGLAAVMVAAPLLDELPLVGEHRAESEKLARLRRSIRVRGFVPTDPIICRVGMKGRWVVVDGGHRITAARQVMRETWCNLWGPKVAELYFLLFTTPGSWKKLRHLAEAEGALPPEPPEDEPPGGGGAPPSSRPHAAANGCHPSPIC
jgi:hypothetical protein